MAGGEGGMYEDGVGFEERGREWGGGAGEEEGGVLEPAGLNSTAEPLTPAIHQCRGVTRQEQGYVCVCWGAGGGLLVTGKETEGL